MARLTDETKTIAIEVTEESPVALLVACARNEKGHILLGWYRITRRRAVWPDRTMLRLRFDAGPFLSREDALA